MPDRDFLQGFEIEIETFFSKHRIASPWFLTAQKFNTLFHQFHPFHTAPKRVEQLKYRNELWKALLEYAPTSDKHGPIHSIGPDRLIRDSLNLEDEHDDDNVAATSSYPDLTAARLAAEADTNASADAGAQESESDWDSGSEADSSAGTSTETFSTAGSDSDSDRRQRGQRHRHSHHRRSQSHASTKKSRRARRLERKLAARSTELDSREVALRRQEQKVDMRVARLDTRETALCGREQLLGARAADLDTREATLLRQEQDLEKRATAERRHERKGNEALDARETAFQEEVQRFEQRETRLSLTMDERAAELDTREAALQQREQQCCQRETHLSACDIDTAKAPQQGRPRLLSILSPESCRRLDDIVTYMRSVYSEDDEGAMQEFKSTCRECAEADLDLPAFRRLVRAAEARLEKHATVPALNVLGQALEAVVRCLPDVIEEVVEDQEDS